MAEETFSTSSNLTVKSVIIDLSGAINGQSLVFDGTKFAPADVVPVGTVEMWVNATAPSGWLMCYGQNVSRSTYSRLFNVIGTSFGSGDGSTTFRLPIFDLVLPLGIAGGGTLGAGTVSIADASFAHNHTIDSSFTSNDQSDTGSHYHASSGGGTHTHTLATANNSHFHGTSGPSGSHTHNQDYIGTSFNSATTGSTAHGFHNGISGVNATVGDHQHGLSSNATSHSHTADSATTSHSHSTFNGLSDTSTTGNSSHAHTVNTQRIYFIIKH